MWTFASPASGYISGTDCERFGIALAMLGGGREKKEDTIDHAVGLQFHKRIGDRVEKGEAAGDYPLQRRRTSRGSKNLIAQNYFIAQEPPSEKRPLIRRILGA